MTRTLTQGELTVVISHPKQENVLLLQGLVEYKLSTQPGFDAEEIRAYEEITTLDPARTSATKFQTRNPRDFEKLAQFLRELLLSNRPFQVRYPSATEVEVSQ